MVIWGVHGGWRTDDKWRNWLRDMSAGARGTSYLRHKTGCDMCCSPVIGWVFHPSRARSIWS